MKILSLDGTWRLQDDAGGNRCDASVPGCVHAALRDAELIPEPYFRDNEKKIRWIAERGWTYSRDVDLPKAFLRSGKIILRFDGLDTLCSVTVNGKSVGSCDNFYRAWEFDVSGMLKPGKNRISLAFDSVIPLIKKGYAKHPLKQFADEDPDRVQMYAYVRKPGYQFGWDWSPALLTAGPWRSVRLIGWDEARLDDVRVIQKHSKDRVQVTVDGKVERLDRTGLTASVVFAGKKKTVTLNGNSFKVSFDLKNPDLWWPNGMGRRTLYPLEVVLLSGHGRVLDIQSRKIGLRTLELVQEKDRWGRSFYFKVNGVPLWGRGANWVPIDSFPSEVTRAKTFRLVAEAAAQNMNIIRIWGGGLYASEDLLDACDAYGILVWHDFQFACSGYPAMDPKFMRNVAAEADEQVRRLRHRASLALWCGNNEIEEGLTADLPGHMSLKDYNSLFDGLLPRTVRLLDGSTPYTRCSGHTPGSRRDRDHSFRLDSGDTHLWWNMRAQAAVAVDIDEKKLAGLDAEAKRRAKWDYIYRLHNGLDKYGRRTIIPRFASEYGRSCFPVMETLKGFASDKDMDPHSSVMECHQRGGNGWLVSEIVSRFKLPKDFPSFVLLSQLSQGESMRELVENWRASKPHNMGFLFWTYVDCWPAVEWSTVDYDLRRKASYYIFKRFYDPFLVCGLESKDLSACDIYGVNDLRTPVSGRMEWTLLRTDGTILLKGSKTAVIPALKSMKISALKFGGLVKDQGAGRCLLWIEFKTRGGAVHSNVVFFTNLNRMELGKPKIRMDRNSDGTIGLKTDIPALWAGIVKKDRLLDCDDNFFHMRPGRTYKVRPDKGESLDGIRIVSLCDTFLSK